MLNVRMNVEQMNKDLECRTDEQGIQNIEGAVISCYSEQFLNLKQKLK